MLSDVLEGVVGGSSQALKQAYFKKYITADELEPRLAAGEELGKMLGGFIKYLRRCGWKDRGSHSEGTRGRRKKRTT